MLVGCGTNQGYTSRRHIEVSFRHLAGPLPANTDWRDGPSIVVYCYQWQRFASPHQILCSILCVLFGPLTESSCVHRIIQSVLGIGDQTFANYNRKEFTDEL